VKRAAVLLAALAACADSKPPGKDLAKLKVTPGDGKQLARFSTRDTVGRIDLAGPWTIEVTLDRAATGAKVTVAGQAIELNHPTQIDLRGKLGGGFAILVAVDAPNARKPKHTTVDVARMVRDAVLADPKLAVGDGDAQHADSVLWVRKGDGPPIGVIGRRDRLDAIDLVAVITETSTEQSCGDYTSLPRFNIASIGTDIKTDFHGGGVTSTVNVRIHTAEVVLLDRRTGAEVGKQHFVPDEAAVADACPGSIKIKDRAPTFDARADRQVDAWLTEKLVWCTTCGAAPVVAEPSARVDAPILDADDGAATATQVRDADGKAYLAVSLTLAEGGGTLRLGDASWPIAEDGTAFAVIDPSKLLGDAELPAPAPAEEPTGNALAPAPELPLRLPVWFRIERAKPAIVVVATEVARAPVLAAVVAATEGLSFGPADVAPPKPRAALLVRDSDRPPELIGAPATIAGIDLVITVARKAVKKSSARCGYLNPMFSSSYPMQVKIVTTRASLVVTARDRRTGAVAATTKLAPPPKAKGGCPDSISVFGSDVLTIEQIADDAEVDAWVDALLAPATSPPT